MRTLTASLFVLLSAQVVTAQDMSALPDPVPLLKGSALQDRLDGAIIACLHGTQEPDLALAAYEAAGWTRSDEFDGTASFFAEGVTTMFWDASEPGFCMVETDQLGTVALQDRLNAVLEQGKWFAVDLVEVEGCQAVDLGTGIVVAPTSGGQDPVCQSDTSAAMRFQLSKK